MNEINQIWWKLLVKYPKVFTLCKIVFILVTFREKMTIWIGEEGVSRLVLLVLDLKLTILQGNLAKVSCIHGGTS